MIESLIQSAHKLFFPTKEERALSFPVIQVPCINEKLEQLQKEKTSVVVPKTQMQEHGWFAICQEDKGKVFAIFEAR